LADAKYLAWCRNAPCAAQPCVARAEAHHSTVAPTFAPGERQGKQLPGKRGRGQKSADYYAIPLCVTHHQELHMAHGFFEDLDVEAWQHEQSALHRERYERRATPEAPTRRVVKEGFDVTAEIEALVKTYQPESGQFRFDLKRFARHLREAVEKGTVF
jgi:hypothetical protein